MAEKPPCCHPDHAGEIVPSYSQFLCRRHYDEQRRQNPEIKAKRVKAQLRYQDKNKEKLNEYRRDWKREDSARRSSELRDRYATDEEYRESVKARVKAWRQAHPEIKKETDRKYREANKDKIKERNSSPEYLKRKRQTYSELKMEVLLAYGDGSCAYHQSHFQCDYIPDDIFELELHHVNGDGAEHRKRLTGQTSERNYSHKFYSELKNLGWPSDVPMVTICGICHKKETLRLQRIPKIQLI